MSYIDKELNKIMEDLQYEIISIGKFDSVEELIDTPPDLTQEEYNDKIEEFHLECYELMLEWGEFPVLTEGWLSSMELQNKNLDPISLERIKLMEEDWNRRIDLYVESDKEENKELQFFGGRKEKWVKN